MIAAGFTPTIHTRTHPLEAPTMRAYWEGLRKSLAPFVALENTLGTDVFEPLAAGILRRLEDGFGSGPVSVPMPAWLAEGHRA